MLHKIIALLAWACLAFIIYATLTPASLRPGLTEREPGLVVLFEHVAAFGLLGFLFSMAHPRKQRFVCITVLGSALILELLQAVSPDRDPRIIDAVEKLVGGGLGISAAQLLFLIVPSVPQLPHGE